jgi:formylmethanofuran dehydrogenase subunit E
MEPQAARSISGPVVLCVRGPSRSGKTALIERLVAGLEPDIGVAYLKRSHHLLDLPGKASARVWQQGPSAMVLRAADRVQVTLPPGEGTAQELIAQLPLEIDLALLETHTAEDFPTLLADEAEPADGERVIGRWGLETLTDDAARAVACAQSMLPADLELHRALRGASKMHGGHACAGLVLGTRLALHAVNELGVPVPDREKRLVVVAETDRCAVDAIQAVTGCRPGKRTLRLLDYGKLAATFIDQRTERAVRVAVRGDLRERVGAQGSDRHQRQRDAYLTYAPDDLFRVTVYSRAEIPQFDRPGPPRRRVICDGCGEEVSDGREVETEGSVRCRPCAAAHHYHPLTGELEWA